MPLTRRQFVKRASAQGALLAIAIGPAGEIIAPRRRRATVAAFTPNQWLTIDSAGVVTLVAHKSEMGQGVRTALPMILAAELGADWRQFEGGVMWALSAPLGKAVEFERGRASVRNFGDYPVIRMREAPAVEVHVVPSALRPFGLGEPPVPAVGPAVLNAIFAATGKRIRQTPIRREELAI